MNKNIYFLVIDELLLTRYPFTEHKVYKGISNNSSYFCDTFDDENCPWGFSLKSSKLAEKIKILEGKLLEVLYG